MFRGMLRGVMVAGVVVLWAAMAPRAEARKGGFFLITHGDAVSKLADLTPEQQSLAKEGTAGAETYVALRYQQFGIWFLELWSWDGDVVLYDERGKQYWDLDDEGLKYITGKVKADFGKPLTYTFPPGLIALVVGAGGVYGVAAYRKWAQAKQLRELMADPRYHRAAELVQQYYERKAAQLKPETDEEDPDGEESDEPEIDLDTSSTDEALRYLVSQGVPREQAARNLALVLNQMASEA